jgi:hypothetical protein
VDRFFRMLADDGDGLRRRNIEARSPVFFSRDAVEVLFNDLLSPRESISAAHKEIMADRIPVGCPSAILKAAAAAPTAPCDQFSRLLPGLNCSSARACHFWPGAQPRAFLRLAAVTLTTGSPLLAAASSVIASPCYCFDGRLEPTRRRSEQCDCRASARTAEIEYGDKTLQEFVQSVSRSRLKLNRPDRLNHESLSRARGLRDDDCVLGWAHSENHTGTLTELQMRVKLGRIRQFVRLGRYLPVAILFGGA